MIYQIKPNNKNKTKAVNSYRNIASHCRGTRSRLQVLLRNEDEI